LHKLRARPIPDTCRQSKYGPQARDKSSLSAIKVRFAKVCQLVFIHDQITLIGERN
jgi:hypothetical protein